MQSQHIVVSFELAAERCEDLAPLVYARLFREHPETEAFFIMDRTGAARGGMLAWVINALIDCVGEGHYGHNLIQAEAVNHQGLGVSPAQFRLFFATLAATLKDVLGEAWSEGMERDWADLLADLDRWLGSDDNRVALPGSTG